MSDAALSYHLRELGPENLRIHIWARKGGGYQINVCERGGNGWTVVHDDDPELGLSTALRQRYAGTPSRRVAYSSDKAMDAPNVEPEQIDIEDAIAAAPADPFEDLLG